VFVPLSSILNFGRNTSWPRSYSGATDRYHNLLRCGSHWRFLRAPTYISAGGVRHDDALTLTDAASVEVRLEYDGWEIHFWQNFGIPKHLPNPEDPSHPMEVSPEITVDDKKNVLESIARRIKSREHKKGGLLGEVVAKGHIGYLSGDVVLDKPYPDLRYEILSCIPEGDVRITEKTRLTVRLLAKR